ncbi:hypothetical protein ZIOFF_050081 [Zingiber officinale]|uniref:Uncharacterized protein n=1 Tax=Zingiber officinale TaxID=94328 RepID=A0A8J5FIJ2_ZINOF|nr:hypothetical protein ZIOFF_050081 [Zingiber officinale]
MVWSQSNSVTGPIPDLSNLKVLESFEVHGNSLTSIMSQSLAAFLSLRIVDLSNNMLQGPLPSFASKSLIQLVETDGNPNLCKNSGSGGESSSPTSGAPSPPDKLSIVGIIIAIVVLVACSVGLLLHHLKKKNKKKFELSIESVNAYHDEPQSLHMSIQALKMTTNNFSEDFILDKGGFGIIYKGNLSKYIRFDGSKWPTRVQNRDRCS